MSVEDLHRIQFALTVSFHFIFPPLSLGVGLILIIFGIKSVRTKDPKWRQLSTFWVKIYGLIFSLGIATGIVQEFEFGTNWSRYSRFVGNIFGSLLAAEGIFAFMLEGGFLGLMLFGGTRLGNRMWLFATTMVVTGATFSAFWIVMANSWMQTPQGFEVRDVGRGPQAFMTSFSDVVFTPSFSARILHVIAASWMVGSSLVLSVGAYYLLKKRHVELAKTMIRVALPVFAVVALLQVAVFGANQATQVARDQPAKLAAMEGLYQTESCAPMFLLGWTNPDEEKTTGLHIPCLLSLLTTKSFDAPVTGLEATPRDDWPNVSLVFQVYHVMINLGMLFVLIGLTACGFWIPRSYSPRSPQLQAGGLQSSVDNRGSFGRFYEPKTRIHQTSRSHRSSSRSRCLSFFTSWCLSSSFAFLIDASKKGLPRHRIRKKPNRCLTHSVRSFVDVHASLAEVSDHVASNDMVRALHLHHQWIRHSRRLRPWRRHALTNRCSQ